MSVMGVGTISLEKPGGHDSSRSVEPSLGDSLSLALGVMGCVGGAAVKG